LTSYSYLHMVLYVTCAEIRLNRSFKMVTNFSTNLVQKDTDRQYNGLTERIIGLEYDRLSPSCETRKQDMGPTFSLIRIIQDYEVLYQLSKG
jgi:hypothetical protein